jgi:hypothetical protein
LPRRYVYVVNVYVVNSGASDGLIRQLSRFSSERRTAMNRGLIGTIIGILVIIILVIVILQLT